MFVFVSQYFYFMIVFVSQYFIHSKDLLMLYRSMIGVVSHHICSRAVVAVLVPIHDYGAIFLVVVNIRRIL